MLGQDKPLHGIVEHHIIIAVMSQLQIALPVYSKFYISEIQDRHNKSDRRDLALLKPLQLLNMFSTNILALVSLSYNRSSPSSVSEYGIN